MLQNIYLLFIFCNIISHKEHDIITKLLFKKDKKGMKYMRLFEGKTIVPNSSYFNSSGSSFNSS